MYIVATIRQKFSTSVAQHIKIRHIKEPLSIGLSYYTFYWYFITDYVKTKI